MTGRAKRICYRIFLIVCGLAAVLGTVLIACSAIDYVRAEEYSYLWVFGFAVGLLLIFPVNTLVHELGHLVFGTLAGMRFSSIRFSRIRIVRIGKHLSGNIMRMSEVAGACEMYPRNDRHVRGKMIVFTLGGAVFSTVGSVAVLVCYHLMPLSPALYFFSLFAPLSILEAFAALYPVETATGKTDGAVMLGLIKKSPDAIVALNVLTAQGILSGGSYRNIKKDLLYNVPVVREDDTGFLALLSLRFGYEMVQGNVAAAMDALRRLESLFDELPALSRTEVACDLVYAYCVLEPDPEHAEKFMTEAANGMGTCAYYRAIAAYSALRGELTEATLSRAQVAADGETIVGIRELEKELLTRIPNSF